jgi:hypothetical protein
VGIILTLTIGALLPALLAHAAERRQQQSRSIIVFVPSQSTPPRRPYVSVASSVASSIAPLPRGGIILTTTIGTLLPALLAHADERHQ